MARPRVFISSTFYDLRQVREDLERFVKDLGYEPVRNEAGHIPYDKSDRLETAAYREVELCDVVISIVGGRFGTDSQADPGYSITQAELRRALEQGIQVFVFVERSVLAEFSTYQVNKTATDVKYRFVDDVRIYEFLEHVYTLPRNNPIAPFETSADIVEYLRTQWAGLFQRFLQENKRLAQIRVLEEMNTMVERLRDTIRLLADERAKSAGEIRDLLLVSHPVFRQIAELTETQCRVFFTNRVELDAWLHTQGWVLNEGPPFYEKNIAEWASRKKGGYIALKGQIFDETGRLKLFSEYDWDREWLVYIWPPTRDEGA